MNPEEIERILRAAMDDAEVVVEGDGRHFQAQIVSPSFEGKPPLKRHRMVYDVLREHIDSEALHAISMRTLTPSEREAG